MREWFDRGRRDGHIIGRIGLRHGDEWRERSRVRVMRRSLVGQSLSVWHIGSYLTGALLCELPLSLAAVIRDIARRERKRRQPDGITVHVDRDGRPM